MFISSPFPEKVYYLNRLKYRYRLANIKNRSVSEMHTLLPLWVLPAAAHSFLQLLSVAVEPPPPFLKEASLQLHINAEATDAIFCVSNNALSFLCHPRSPGFFLNKNVLVFYTLAWGRAGRGGGSDGSVFFWKRLSMNSADSQSR